MAKGECYVTPAEFEALFSFLGDVGGNALLLFVLWGFVTGRIVTRFHYDEMERLHTDRIERIKNGKRAFPFPNSDD